MKLLRLFHELQRRLTAFWFNIRLGTKMTVIVVIGTLALISLFAYLGTTALNENIERSLQERVVLAQTTALHMDYVLADVEHILTDSASQDIWNDPARSAAALESAFRRLGDLSTHCCIVPFDRVRV